MLTDERDLVRLCDAVQRIIALLRHPTVAAITQRVSAAGTPLHELDSRPAVESWLRDTVNDYVHAAGTCRMGRRGDATAVVDTQCRVIGYRALRVCDASIMPDLPKANTHLTTVAIAEHLVAILRRTTAI